MLKEWPECIDDLFRIQNVFLGSHLLDLKASFLLGSTQVLAAPPHLQKVVNLGRSAQFPVLRLFLHFPAVFCVHGFQFGVSGCQKPGVGSSKLPSYDFFAKSLACCFRLPTADDISA